MHYWSTNVKKAAITIFAATDQELASTKGHCKPTRREYGLTFPRQRDTFHSPGNDPSNPE